jgi:hypothetical protein
LVFVGAAALAAGIVAIDPSPVGAVHDDAGYVVLARSLATGHGYRNLNLPGSPASIHVPPGYPAFLALLWWADPVFPNNLVLFKAANLVLLGLAAVLLARFAQSRVLDAAWAVGTGVVAAISIPMLIVGSLLLSEALFFLVVIALLPALESFAERPSAVWRALALGAGIAVCSLVRSHGIALLPGVLLVLAVRRRWRDAALVTAATIVCLAPWQVWAGLHAGAVPAPLEGAYGSYASWWVRGAREMGASMIPATLAKTVPESTRTFAALFSPAIGPLARAVTIVSLAALAAAGVRATWRRIPVTVLFMTGYFAIVLLWPFPPTRFIWGLWPLILLVIAAGARDVMAAARASLPRGENVFARIGGFANVAAFAWVAIGYGMYEVRGIRGNWWSSIPRLNAPRIMWVARWIATNTEPGDVVATEDDGAVYLYTGRLTVPVLAFTAAQYFHDRSAAENVAEGLAPILAAYPVRTIVAGTPKQAEAADFLVNARPPRLAMRMDSPFGVAYTVLGR